jgi:NAD-dependent SIR2 family protein deacetylase
MEDNKMSYEPTMWTKLPEKRIPKSQCQGVDILAKEVSRAQQNHPRHALLLGAGASVSSGITTTETLIDKWRHMFFFDRLGIDQPFDIDKYTKKYTKMYKKWSNKTGNGEPSKYEKDAREWEQLHERNPSEYAFLFNFVASLPNSRQELIERLVEYKEPGPGYIYLASLVRAGCFRTILTTNFDDLVHDALFRYSDMKPAVCAFDSQITSIHPNTARPTIVKLHGDFMYNNMRNVGTEVQRLSLNMRDKLYQTCKNNGLIVLGYAGGDESIMMPLSTMLHDGNFLNDGLHWCFYCPNPDEKDVVIPGEVWRLHESHPKRVKLYYTEGFDHTMELMYSNCNCEPPLNLANPREHSPFQRLNKALQSTDQKHLVSSHFNKMMKNFIRTDHSASPWYAHDLDLADYHFIEGTSALKEEDYDKADEELLSSLLYCEGVINGEPTQPATSPEKPNTSAIVRAHRRKSGCIAQQARVLLKKTSIELTVSKLTTNSGIDKIIAVFGRNGFDIAKEGLDLGRNKTECTDNMRALAFNALLSLGYLRLALGPLPPDLCSEHARLKKELQRYDTDGRDLKLLTEKEYGYRWIDKENC